MFNQHTSKEFVILHKMRNRRYHRPDMPCERWFERWWIIIFPRVSVQIEVHTRCWNNNIEFLAVPWNCSWVLSTKLIFRIIWKIPFWLSTCNCSFGLLLTLVLVNLLPWFFQSPPSATVSCPGVPRCLISWLVFGIGLNSQVRSLWRLHFSTQMWIPNSRKIIHKLDPLILPKYPPQIAFVDRVKPYLIERCRKWVIPPKTPNSDNWSCFCIAMYYGLQACIITLFRFYKKNDIWQQLPESCIFLLSDCIIQRIFSAARRSSTHNWIAVLKHKA